MTPYRVSTNVKEKSDGYFSYSFSVEKTEGTSTPRTLHAVVSSNTENATNGNSFAGSICNKNVDVKTFSQWNFTVNNLAKVSGSFLGIQKSWTAMESLKLCTGVEMRNLRYSTGKNQSIQTCSEEGGLFYGQQNPRKAVRKSQTTQCRD